MYKAFRIIGANTSVNQILVYVKAYKVLDIECKLTLNSVPSSTLLHHNYKLFYFATKSTPWLR